MDQLQTISEQFISSIEGSSKENFILNSILGSSIDSLVILKAIRDQGSVYDFEYLLVNPSAEAMLNKQASDLIGKKVLDLYPGTKDEGVFNLYLFAINLGEPFDIKFFYPHDGLKKWFRQIGVRIDSNRLLIITSDVTRQSELVRINSDLDNFIYSASHDLKAPVSNIEGLMSALTDTLDPQLMEDENIKSIIAMINTSLNRFRKTISDLTDVSKIYKNQQHGADVIDIKRTIENVQLGINDLIRKDNVNVLVDTEACNQITFSKANFQSILSNLFTNAIKYKSPDRTPEIIVKTRIVNNEVVLVVKDNGLGMEKESLDQIFTMFVRLHDHVEGSGMGLFIVKRIVEGSGGKVEVESEVGKGTTFTIYFKNINGKAIQ